MTVKTAFGSGHLAALRKTTVSWHDESLQSAEKINNKRVDGLRTLPLNPMPGALQNVATAQARQGFTRIENNCFSAADSGDILLGARGNAAEKL